MEKTFTINTKMAGKIMDSYKNFLSFNYGNSDEFTNRVLKLIDELDAEKLNLILEKVFHASLKKEEGKHHNFSLILSPPEYKFNDLLKPYTQKHFCGYFNDVCSFEEPIDIVSLPKLAPAFEHTNRKLRVWFNNKNEPEIWGFASYFFNYFGIEIKSFSPGQLLVHIKPMDFPHKRYLITLSESKLVIGHDNLIKLLFDESLTNEQKEITNTEKLLQLNNKKQQRYWFPLDVINKIMDHKHGGTLLFIRQENFKEIFEESIRSISYFPKSQYEYIKRSLIEKEKKEINLDKTANEASFLAQTTAVDGATFINKDFEILGFGAKIKPKELLNDKKETFEKVWIKEPFENFKEHAKNLAKIGGMRHQSTAQFVFDQKEKNVFAIVASEDGKISIMYWDSNRIWIDEEENHRKGIVTMLRHVEYLFYGMNI